MWGLAMTAPDCGLMRPGQPCAKWATPPRGVCSRRGGNRVCGECISDVDGPVLGFRRREQIECPAAGAVVRDRL